MDILKILMNRMPFSKEITLDTYAHLTEGFSGAEITSLCQNAAIKALERNISNLEVISAFLNVNFNFLHRLNR
jgi:SpoVK/Ycf46/Vps4 family AAA+-type ATPase